MLKQLGINRRRGRLVEIEFELILRELNDVALPKVSFERINETLHVHALPIETSIAIHSNGL